MRVRLLVDPKRVSYNADLLFKNQGNRAEPIDTINGSRNIDLIGFQLHEISVEKVESLSPEEAQRSLGGNETFLGWYSEMRYPICTRYTLLDGQRFIFVQDTTEFTRNFLIQVGHASFQY